MTVVGGKIIYDAKVLHASLEANSVGGRSRFPKWQMRRLTCSQLGVATRRSAAATCEICSELPTVWELGGSVNPTASYRQQFEEDARSVTVLLPDRNSARERVPSGSRSCYRFA